MTNNDLWCRKCESHHHPVECPNEEEMTKKETMDVKSLWNIAIETDYILPWRLEYEKSLNGHSYLVNADGERIAEWRCAEDSGKFLIEYVNNAEKLADIALKYEQQSEVIKKLVWALEIIESGNMRPPISRARASSEYMQNIAKEALSEVPKEYK